MKFNIKLITIASALAIGVFSGCKRGDSFYTSPNNPAEVTPSLLLTAIEVSTFNSYEGFLVKGPSVLMQQNAGIDGQMAPINNYLMAENEFDNQWAQSYQALFSVRDLQTRFGSKNPYYSGIADILAVMNWGQLTDLWGDIPFSEALQGKDNYKAKYDSQEDVIKGMMALLDGAITKLGMSEEANELLPGNDDVAFGGDTEQWIRVAYALKARYMNRASNKGIFTDADILAALEKGITEPAHDFVTRHGTRPNEANQWYDFQNNRPFYAVAGLPFVDSIKLRATDVRLQQFFTLVNGEVVGSPIDEPNPEASEWGAYLAGSGATGVHIISFMEAKFIEAEVKIRQGNAPDAATALNTAIQESCKLVTNGVYDGADIATYTGTDVNLSRVMYEKWIAMFGTAEPYNDYRRTGFPALTPNPSGRLPVIPKRFPTPQNERVSNPNAPVPALTTPVWFAQN